MYKCRVVNGKQLVYEEIVDSESEKSIPVVWIVTGLVLGLCYAIALYFLTPSGLTRVLAALALIAAVLGLRFIKLHQIVPFCIFLFGCGSLIYGIQRMTMYIFNQNVSVVTGLSCVAVMICFLSNMIYWYLRISLREDTRKHRLQLLLSPGNNELHWSSPRKDLQRSSTRQVVDCAQSPASKVFEKKTTIARLWEFFRWMASFEVWKDICPQRKKSHVKIWSTVKGDFPFLQPREWCSSDEDEEKEEQKMTKEETLSQSRNKKLSGSSLRERRGIPEERMKLDNNHDGSYSGRDKAKKRIVLRNRSLKCIKGVLYCGEDVFQWIPAGGIDGCVTNIEDGETAIFNPPDRIKKDKQYMLKVFAPNLLDRELARCYCSRGDIIEFIDTTQQVKRSSSSHGMLQQLSSAKSQRTAGDLDSSSVSSDNSQDLVTPMDTGRPGSASLPGSAARPQRGVVEYYHNSSQHPTISSGSGAMRKVTSGNLLAMVSSPKPASNPSPLDSSNKSVQSAGSPSMVRRVLLEREIEVSNKASHEISARLFNPNDHTYLVALSDTGTVVPGDSAFLTLPESFSHFTLKIYTVTAQPMELTYLTVYPSERYVYKDPVV